MISEYNSRVICTLTKDLVDYMNDNIPGWFHLNGRDVFIRTKSELVQEALFTIKRIVKK